MKVLPRLVEDGVVAALMVMEVLEVVVHDR